MTTGAAMRVDAEQLAGMADTRLVRRRRIGATLLNVVVALLVVAAVVELVVNPNFDWPIVARYLFDTNVLEGVLVTLELTVYAMVIGLVLGVVLAVLRQSRSGLARGAAWSYIWFFRGTPVLVQVLFWGFAASLFPRVGIGLPGGLFLVSWDTNAVVPIFAAAVLGLGLNEAAYMAEIVRGGLLSVPSGQTEAARTLGLGHAETLRFVILPQAMRVIIPPIGNQVISMLKMTSVVLVIGVADLLGSVTEIYARNYRQIALLLVASIWYLALTTLLTYGQSRLERRFGRGISRLEDDRA
ncbi:amino acid ABC transporter permease [Pseudonocardia sp. TRM90224]|uniref:amino acid ABC transporter permease n=1 Tax=Pseudonocardia sp. TRM90224 TaxID=2812678 RepID=UPI001E461E33|nr:amino acid ABC transporter permease [Pseudonocardia sp. TRM90224]